MYKMHETMVVAKNSHVFMISKTLLSKLYTNKISNMQVVLQMLSSLIHQELNTSNRFQGITFSLASVIWIISISMLKRYR